MTDMDGVSEIERTDQLNDIGSIGTAAIRFRTNWAAFILPALV